MLAQRRCQWIFVKLLHVRKQKGLNTRVTKVIIGLWLSHFGSAVAAVPSLWPMYRFIVLSASGVSTGPSVYSSSLFE